MPKKKRKTKKKPLPSHRNKLLSVFIKYWKIFLGITVAVPFLYWLYANFLKPKYTQFSDEKKISHEIKSPRISAFKFQTLENKPPFIYGDGDVKFPTVNGIKVPGLKNDIMPISIQIGGYVYLIPSVNLYNGMQIITATEEYDLPLVSIIAKDDRLYVSAKFLDLANEFEIGEMKFNHWSLYRENLLDYHYDDKKLEVIDKRGNIVFSIAYENSMEIDSSKLSFLVIAGYFISPRKVLVLNNLEYFNGGHYINDHAHELFNKADSGYKNDALVEIRKIRSIF